MNFLFKIFCGNINNTKKTKNKQHRNWRFLVQKKRDTQLSIKNGATPITEHLQNPAKL